MPQDATTLARTMNHRRTPRTPNPILRGLLWIVLWFAGMVLFVVLAVVTHSVLDLPGAQKVFDAAAVAGKWIVVGAVTILASDLIVMTIYTIRHGQRDAAADKAITAGRPLNISLGVAPALGRSRIKTLGRRSTLITAKSLADGSATRGERLMVLGIVSVFIGFGLIFVGVGFMLAKNMPLLILFPVLPGLFVYYNLQSMWQDYRDAKEQVLTLPRNRK